MSGCEHGVYRCKTCREADETIRVAAEGTDREWFNLCGHCGHCGDPGDYCTCSDRDPCGCRDLHPMGSGLAPDALAAFSVGPVTVSNDQAELF